ncbi:MAG: hypothetical protein IT314_01080 [Anaerolineales bacterium]|nr:hypothetical protein [Anaerolineales bacterium]
MKQINAIMLATILALLATFNAGAQAPETIWLTASTTAYKTNETVVVTVNAVSATPIQGFTFQIRYDPQCLKPVNASSLLPGMNGLQLPQISGLVDGSYASTTPLTVNGVLAEVRFTALQGCQTDLTLESAALAVRSAEGFAAPLPSVLIGERNVSLSVDSEVGAAQAPVDSGSVLALDPPPAENGFPFWLVGIAVGALIGLGLLGIFKTFRAEGSR